MTSIPRDAGAAQAPIRNILASLAEDVRAEMAAGRRLSVEGAERYLRAARRLAEARTEAKRSEWGPFLARAGVKPSTARAMIQLHRAGVTAERLADVGVMAARRELAKGAEPPAESDAGDDAGEAAQDGEPGAGGPFPGPVGAEKPLSDSGNGPATDDVQGPATAGRRGRYGKRRSAGRCGECGGPSGGAARCERCAALVSERRRRRRALAGIGDALAGRIEEAAAAGREALIPADEAAALAERLAGKGR